MMILWIIKTFLKICTLVIWMPKCFDLLDDSGEFYILNGQKSYITNADWHQKKCHVDLFDKNIFSSNPVGCHICSRACAAGCPYRQISSQTNPVYGAFRYFALSWKRFYKAIFLTKDYLFESLPVCNRRYAGSNLSEPPCRISYRGRSQAARVIFRAGPES